MYTYKFSPKSLAKLEGVHPDLQRVVSRAMTYQIIDFSVNEGVRTRERQAMLVAQGKSQTMNSKHLKQLDGYGHAVDLYPSPIDMVKLNKSNPVEVCRFGVLAGLMLLAAKEECVRIKWGGDWDGDGQTLDHSFFDAPHFELIK